VEADLSTGVVTKNTTAFTSSGNIPLYKIVTGGTTVTSYEDWRTKGGASGGGGSTSPLTTKGDIYTRSSSADARLAVGSDGQVLTADAASTNGVKWAFAPATLNRVDGGDFSTNAWACGTPAACSSSASVSLDGRWTVSTTSAATFNIIKVADVPTFDNSGYGATHSLQVDCTAGDATVAATDYTVITHTIPVAAMKDLGAGGGSAGRYVTVSFWVRSLQTGTYGFTLRTGTARVYVSPYTISSASTWEQKTIVIPVDITGTWTADWQLVWCLMAGSSYVTASTNTWIASSNAVSTSAQVNVASLTTGDFRLELVQLVEGGAAQPYDEPLPVWMRSAAATWTQEVKANYGGDGSAISIQRGGSGRIGRAFMGTGGGLNITSGVKTDAAGAFVAEQTAGGYINLTTTGQFTSYSYSGATVGTTPTFTQTFVADTTGAYSNSAKLATESYVSGSYLPLAGGLLTGDTQIVKATPQFYLNATGATDANLFLSVGGGARWAIQSSSSSTSNLNVLRYNTSGVFQEVALSIDNSSGDVTITKTITAADVIDLSDRKFKRNIEPISGALDKVRRLRGVNFERTDIPGYHMGLIAQDVAEVVPEVVHDTEHGLGVAYGNLVGLLIEAIKEQDARIAQLEARLMKGA
jgi:hypothetical protein